MGTRRVRWARSTRNPDSALVAQKARNLLLELPEGDAPRFLIRDRDAEFSDAFDEVFRAEGTRIIHAPIRTPQANAYAERWVRTVPNECLDLLLILSRRHLTECSPVPGTLQAGQAAPGHRSRDSRGTRGSCAHRRAPRIHRRDVLGGLIHEYEVTAA